MVSQLGFDFFVIDASVFTHEVVQEISKVILEMCVTTLNEVFIIVEILRAEIGSISVHLR